MKGKLVLFAFSMALMLSACVRNEVEIDMVEDGCKWLGIDYASHDVYEDPCNGRNRVSLEFGSTHDEDTGCIQYLKIDPVFYDRNNQPIEGFTFHKTRVEPDFFLSETELVFPFELDFGPSGAQNEVNHMVMNYFIESQDGDESNTLSVRVHFPCTEINENFYDVVNKDSIINIPPNLRTFPLEFWDHAAEDGDLITVYVNNQLVVETLELFNNRKRFDVPTSWLSPGRNDVAVFALNQGSSGPNTCSLSINGKDIKLGSFANGLMTGQAVSLDF